MKIPPLQFVIFFVFIALSSCQSSGVQQTSDTDASVVNLDTSKTEGSAIYPGPESISGPEMGSIQDLPSVLYPAYQDQDEIPWIHAVAMIMNGEITKVQQSKDLKVVLFLKDGRSLLTHEPNKDEIKKTLELCGEKCAGIELLTE